MERLTIRGDHGIFMADGYDFEIEPDCYDLVQEILARFAAYEDTGMDPEEIECILDAYGRGMTLRQETGERLRLIHGISTDRLRELVQADKDGQLVVLPCKAGDTVYVTDLRKGEAVPCEVLCYSALDGTGNGIIEYKVPREIPDIVSVEASMEEIGKTVFLTREEAEKALEGGGSDG